MSRKAKIPNKNKGSVKKSDKTNSAEDAKSTALKTSPVKINNPFKSRSPAHKRII